LRGMDAQSWKVRSARLKSEILAIYLACQHPETPWYARALAVFILGYALSPIDLIPDFIPVLGQLDDLVLIPAGMALLVRLIPREVMEECREKARSQKFMRKRANRVAAGIILLVWLLTLYAAVRYVSLFRCLKDSVL
jgi:uncharacterized membrane protein YkvA (DUF1232 family)